MKEKKKIATYQIEDFVNKTPADKVAIADLIRAMDGAGFGLTLMVFSFGIIIPLPPPFPTIIAIPLAIFSFQMMIGLQAPKLPQRFSKLKVKRSVLALLVRKSSPYIGKVEAILRPRLIFMLNPVMERVIGFLIFIFSSFVIIPLPFSNFIPGLGVLIVSFGLIGKDGLVIILGIFVGFIGMLVSIIAFFLGLEALTYIKNLFI